MSKNENPVSPVYGFLRQWFNFAFENQGKVTGNHTAIYCWFIEQNNRMGWVKEFGAPRDQTMAASGISSYNTYKKCFNDLVDWGFVKMVKKSKNQYVAHIIALSKFDKARRKSLDNSLSKADDLPYQNLTEHGLGTVYGTGHSTSHGTVALNIPINLYTNKHIVVVEYADANNFFLKSRNFTALMQVHSLDEVSIKKFFERFYNEKVDLGEFNNKSCADLVKHFTVWLPKIILSEKNKPKDHGSNKTVGATSTETIIDTTREFFVNKYGADPFSGQGD